MVVDMVFGVCLVSALIKAWLNLNNLIYLSLGIDYLLSVPCILIFIGFCYHVETDYRAILS